MTFEEALIVLLAAGAVILLFVGLAQALDNRPPTPVRRGRRPGERARGRRSAEPGAGAVEPAVRPPTSRWPNPEPHSDDTPPQEEEDPESLAALEAAPWPVPADPRLALLEASVTLYQSAKHQELLAAVEPYLRSTARAQGDEATRGDSHALSAVWSLAGLSRQAMGDPSGARHAFEAALATAPEAAAEVSWESCPPRLAALSVSVGRRLLEMAERSPEGGTERIIGPRLAQVWLAWRLAVAPGDRAPGALLEHAREALAGGYWEVGRALIRRQDFGEARALVQQGLDRGELPTERGAALLELLSTSLTEEIGRLTAPAIRGTADESQAVVALETAQAMLAGPVDAAMTPAQRSAVTRRLWRGYAKLGIRRLESENFEAAMEALFTALGMREIDARRQRQVRNALLRTLERLAETGAGAVTRLLGEGNRPAAVEVVQRLLLHIQRAREEGIPREELNVTTAKARQLVEHIDQAQVR